MNSILASIHPAARDVILGSETFQDAFKKPSDAFVMAVDLRRSTELMLKAREPHLSAKFISALSNGLRRIVLDAQPYTPIEPAWMKFVKVDA